MIIYKCDICNREVESEEDLDIMVFATRTVDICWFCRQKIKDDYRNKLKEFDYNYLENLKHSIK